MWKTGWRKQIWDDLSTPWDLVVVGGGITGAGILAEAVRRGYRALLVEAKDFGYGTSSRSSKMVHGGLRYMKQAQFHLTLESVRERDKLLQETKGLVMPLEIHGICMHGDKTPAWVFGLGLTIYDRFTQKHWKHSRLTPEETAERIAVLRENAKLARGYHYYDAQTDDSRLVLRVIRDAVREGGQALNYAPATELLRHNDGSVAGVVIRDDASGGRTAEVPASVVINAAGIWSDQLRRSLGKKDRLRAIRGSHLVFPSDKFPLTSAMTLFHPRDNRAVFAIPWQGVVLLGTTDEDHKENLSKEPRISQSEAEYLAELLDHVFPGLELTLEDSTATFAGVRPVVDTGKRNPTKESREHALWWEDGLLTIAGGKLTTFRKMAIQAMNKAQKHLPKKPKPEKASLFSEPPEGPALEADEKSLWIRLQGLYGMEAQGVLESSPERFESIQGSVSSWNELRWAAKQEGVVHLDDLLLRRLRLGLTLPDGGHSLLPRIQEELQEVLQWSPEKWEQEIQRYLKIRNENYHLKGASSPD